MPLYYGADADTDLSPHISAMKAAGLSFVRRYLKNLSPREFAALHAAQLATGFIYETAAHRPLLGQAAGEADGELARHQADALFVASGVFWHESVAIWPAMDGDVPDADSVAACVAYWTGFASSIAGRYALGGYAPGTVLKALAADVPGFSLPWLPGAMGWHGSHDFAASLLEDTGTWCIQGPTLEDGGSWWPSHLPNFAGTKGDWPPIGTAYDPNLANSLAGMA